MVLGIVSLIENGCHFVISKQLFFFSLRKITWFNSQQPKTRGHVEQRSVCTKKLINIKVRDMSSFTLQLFRWILKLCCKNINIWNWINIPHSAKRKKHKDINDTTKIISTHCYLLTNIKYFIYHRIFTKFTLCNFQFSDVLNFTLFP